MWECGPHGIKFNTRGKEVPREDGPTLMRAGDSLQRLIYFISSHEI